MRFRKIRFQISYPAIGMIGNNDHYYKAGKHYNKLKNIGKNTRFKTSFKKVSPGK